MRNSLEPLYCRAPLMMFFLVANVVYHPLQIPSAETHHAVTGLPVQQFPICDFMIDVMRARALQLSNPVTNQKSWRYSDRDVHMCFGATDLVEDET